MLKEAIAYGSIHKEYLCIASAFWDLGGTLFLGNACGGACKQRACRALVAALGSRVCRDAVVNMPGPFCGVSIYEALRASKSRGRDSRRHSAVFLRLI